MLDGGAVHERFERGPRLALGLDGAIELGIIEALAAHQAANLACLVLQYDHGGLDGVVLQGVGEFDRILPGGAPDVVQVLAEEGVQLEGGDRIADPVALAQLELVDHATVHELLDIPGPARDGRIGGDLDFAIHRQVHDKPLVVERVLAPFLLDVLADHFQEVGAVGVRLGRAESLDGHGGGLLGLLGRDDAFVFHGSQHHVAPALGRLFVAVGAVLLGRLDHACQGRRLDEVELPDILPEVDARSGLHAVGTVAQVDLVEIEGQELAFGVVALELDRGDGFLDLARDRPLRGQEDILGELLREGGATLALAAQRVQGRTHGAPEIHAPMLVELAVLDGQHGLLEGEWDRIQRNPVAAFHEEFAEGHPVLVQDLGRKGRGDAAQVLQRWDFLVVMKEEEPDDNDTQQQRGRQRREADEVKADGNPWFGGGHVAGKLDQRSNFACPCTPLVQTETISRL